MTTDELLVDRSRHLQSDGTLVVSLAGELDMATTDVVTRYLEHCIGEGHREIAVDLTAVAFVDGSGLSAFIAIRGLLEGLGGDLTLRNPQPAVRKLLEMTGLSRLLSD